MGILSWVMLILLSLSTISWLQTKQVVDQSYLMVFDQHSSLAQYKDNASEYNTRAFMREISGKESNECPFLIIGNPKYPEALEKGYVQYNKGSSYRRKKALGQNRKTTQLSRFLHFNELFTEETYNSSRKKSELAICTRLLKTKYAPLFSDYHLGLFGLETDASSFLADLVQKSEELQKSTSIKESKRLANIECSTPTNSYILYRILVGGGCLYQNQPIQLPKFASIVSMKKRQAICFLYLASRPIIEAIAHDMESAQAILYEREAIYTQLKKMKEEEREIQKIQLEEEFRTKTIQYIADDIDPQYISFQISQTKPNKYIKNRL